MMNIGIGTAVYCADHFYGSIATVILNPASLCLTYLVVMQQPLLTRSTCIEWLIPIQLATGKDSDGITLSCDMSALAEMTPFRKTHYMEVEPADDVMKGMLWPPTPAETRIVVPVKQKQVPDGEIAIGRDTQVNATDGHIGRFDQFVVTVGNGCVTHLILQWGHLWEQKRAAIPVTKLTHIQDNTIYLSLSKRDVTELPSKPIS